MLKLGPLIAELTKPVFIYKADHEDKWQSWRWTDAAEDIRSDRKMRGYVRAKAKVILKKEWVEEAMYGEDKLRSCDWNDMARVIASSWTENIEALLGVGYLSL